MYDNLINRLQENVEWAKENEWEAPRGLADCLTEAIHVIGKLDDLWRSEIETNVMMMREIERIKRNQRLLEMPCDLCVYSPPSSCDGKPCTMCPAMSRRV